MAAIPVNCSVGSSWASCPVGVNGIPRKSTGASRSPCISRRVLAAVSNSFGDKLLKSSGFSPGGVGGMSPLSSPRMIAIRSCVPAFVNSVLSLSAAAWFFTSLSIASFFRANSWSKSRSRASNDFPSASKRLACAWIPLSSISAVNPRNTAFCFWMSLIPSLMVLVIASPVTLNAFPMLTDPLPKIPIKAVILFPCFRIFSTFLICNGVIIPNAFFHASVCWGISGKPSTTATPCRSKRTKKV